MGTIKEQPAKDGKPRYHARVRLKGHPIACGTFPNKTKAKEFIQRTEAAIKEGRYFKAVEAKKHTFGEMIDRYISSVLPRKPKSYQKQKMQLLWWKEQIGHLVLADVSPAILVELRDKLGNEPLGNGQARSPSTVVRYLAALSHVFSVAMKEWGWIEDTPMRKVSKPREPKGRVRFLNPDERTRLLNACKNSQHPYLHLIVVIALSTGMRYSEIMNRVWKDIDFQEQRIVLEETKNGERRAVPLVGYAHTLLLEHFNERKMDTLLVFPSSKDPQSPTSIRSAWTTALIQSNVPNFRFHDLRHSFASELAMGKATDTELRILMGHKSPSMTARYAHLTEAHRTEVVDTMTKRIFEKEQGSNG